MNGKDSENVEGLSSDCRRSQMNVETTLQLEPVANEEKYLVLLDKTEIDMTVKDLRKALESSEFVNVPALELQIEKNAELPELKWIVSLMPMEYDSCEDSDPIYSLEVQFFLLEGFEKLQENMISYDLRAEVLNDGGGIWKTFDCGKTRDLKKYLYDQSLSLNLSNDDDGSSLKHLEELPLRSDGSLVFRITLQLSANRNVDPKMKKSLAQEGCRRSKIKFETLANEKNLVLLDQTEVLWKVMNLRQTLESPEPLSAFNVPQFDFTVEECSELPELKWRVSLVQDEDRAFYNSVESYTFVVRWQLLDGYEKLQGNKLFHRFKMEVLNEEGIVWKTREFLRSDLRIDMEKCKQQFELYLTGRGDARKHLEVLPLASDGSLTFRFTLQYFANRMTVSFEKEVGPKTVECWLKHFERRAQADGVIVAGTEPDVQIISSDGKTGHFHKELLIARSPVFEAMFRSEMKESQSGVVKLDDLSEEAVSFIHHFIYDGKLLPYVEKWRCSADLEEIELCIYVVTKYQLEGFIKFFDKLLGNLCNEANAMDLLKLCNRFSLMGAREDVREFIHAHPEVLNNIV